MRPARPARPEKPARPDNEYKRCGTANVFGVVEPKAGRRFTSATPNRSAAQFAQVVSHVVEQYPVARTIHLVMDNLNIHCRKSLVDSFGERAGGELWDRLTVHYTPKHESWLNQAEIELSLYSRQCLGKRRIPDLGTLRRETRVWNRRPTAGGPGSTGSSRASRLARRSTTANRVVAAKGQSSQIPMLSDGLDDREPGPVASENQQPQAGTASRHEFLGTKGRTGRNPRAKSGGASVSGG